MLLLAEPTEGEEETEQGSLEASHSAKYRVCILNIVSSHLILISILWPSLQMVITAMKLKDAYSLEGKL